MFDDVVVAYNEVGDWRFKMTSYRILPAAAAFAVLAASSVCYGWQNGAGGMPQGYLWGGPSGWGQSHFQYAPPSAFGTITSPPPQFSEQQLQNIQTGLSQWQPGLVTPSWWLTVGRPVPIQQPTSQQPTSAQQQQSASGQNNDSQSLAPPADGQPLPVAPPRVRSKVFQFNPQSGKLEDANVIRW
jgi:hypothetical protein